MVIVYICSMRVISKKTLIDFWELYPEIEQPLKAWYSEVKAAEWSSSSDLKEQFGSASIIDKKRVVFNLKGNKYRLIVDIEYRLKIVFIVWVGTHNEYNKINVKEVSYDKTNKK